MKTSLLAFAAVVGLSSVAAAADLPYKAAPMSTVRPACAQFGGFYIGANAGWGYHDYKWSDRDAWTGELSDNLQRSNVNSTKGGFIGGVQGGYNLQSGCTLFGVEVDYSWSDIGNTIAETDGDVGIDTDTLTVQSRMRGIGTIRARTGVIIDNLLVYVTGGFAFGDFQRTFTQTDLTLPGVESFSYNKVKWGWTAGVGTEWAFTNNWSFKSEVLYTRFETDEQTFICAAAITCGLPGVAKRFGGDDEVWTTKFGINYRFR